MYSHFKVKNIWQYFLGRIRCFPAVPKSGHLERSAPPHACQVSSSYYSSMGTVALVLMTSLTPVTSCQSLKFSLITTILCVSSNCKWRKKMFTGSAWVECWCDWVAILKEVNTFAFQKHHVFPAPQYCWWWWWKTNWKKLKLQDIIAQKKLPAFLPCLHLYSKRVWMRLVSLCCCCLIKVAFVGKDDESSPCLCSQQLVVVRRALVVVLPVPDDRGQAFADQCLCDVTRGGRREKKWGRALNEISRGRGRVSRWIPIEVCCATKKTRGMTNPKGGGAEEQRSPKCWHFTLD